MNGTKTKTRTPTTTNSSTEEARDAEVPRIAGELNCKLVRSKKKGVCWVSSDGARRLVCRGSSRTDGPSGSSHYYFEFTPRDRAFLLEAGQGWVALVCADSG